ncbi:MAG: hypothetical protein HY033_13445 [Ignavibacteriae bacterium]|nr:hypothetical protein [Ignavibacteriota bacterium]
MTDGKFTVIIKRSPDYKLYPANGVYGGPTPDGLGIMMNICMDHAAFPNYIQHPISSEGKVDTTTIQDQAVMGDLERELLCGICMSLEQAKRMRFWLDDIIKKIEGHRNV